MENAGTETYRPETVTIDQEAELVAAAVAEFPAEFGLRAYPKRTFRVSPTASYYCRGWNHGDGNRSPAGVQVYTQVQVEETGEWMDFAKGFAAELRRELVESPRYSARRLELEERAETLSEKLEGIDEAQHELDEQRRTANQDFDILLALAADELEDEDFNDIFGSYPDRSNRPETKGF